MYVYVLMRDEKEGRKKQARSKKQQGSHFSYTGKMSCLVWTSNPHNYSTRACTCMRFRPYYRQHYVGGTMYTLPTQEPLCHDVMFSGHV